MLRDTAVWIVPGAAGGVLVGLSTGSWPDAVPVLVATLVLVVLEVVRVRGHVREQHPVGEWVRTVLTEHRLERTTGDIALPHVTDVRIEGRVVRIDFGKDHTHVLPTTIDIEAVRLRAGVPAPEPLPVPGSRVVEVPPGLGTRAAIRVAAWNAIRGPGVGVAWAVAVVLLVLGQWAMGTAVVLWQAGSLVAQAVMERRTFDRAFPSGIPVDVQRRGSVLEVRSARGLGLVDLGAATEGSRTGHLFVVRRTGMPPFWVPDVVVTDDLRADLARGI